MFFFVYHIPIENNLKLIDLLRAGEIPPGYPADGRWEQSASEGQKVTENRAKSQNLY
jgi:hypothetical protein